MTRLLMATAVIVLVVFSSDRVLAQDNPAIGTWKLNLAKSKYNNPVQAPMSQTRKVEAQGKGVKVSYEGVAADGSGIAYSFTSNYDGRDSLISGSGQGTGADTIAMKRIDSHTTVSIMKKAGKVIATTRTVISKDGRVTTVTSKGTDAKGQPRNTVSVFDKQ